MFIASGGWGCCRVYGRYGGFDGISNASAVHCLAAGYGRCQRREPVQRLAGGGLVWPQGTCIRDRGRRSVRPLSADTAVDERDCSGPSPGIPAGSGGLFGLCGRRTWDAAGTAPSSQGKFTLNRSRAEAVGKSSPLSRSGGRKTMWVNQQPSNIPPAEQTLPIPESLPETLPQGQVNKKKTPSDDWEGKSHPVRRRKDSATQDCLMLAAAYLFGTALAGVLRALCDRGDIQLLTYYLTCWQKLFAAQDSGAAVGLFLAEYLTVAGALTAVLLLGLSALGPLPVFLFVILYGIGTGLISAPLLGEFQLPQSLVYLLLGGIPAAIAAGCLCLFGTSALQVCSRLHSVSFGGKIPAPTAGNARGLVGQYLLFAAVFAPLCGAATGLLCLLNRLGS